MKKQHEQQQSPKGIRPEILMFGIGILAVLIIFGVYAPQSNWFARYDNGGAHVPLVEQAAPAADLIPVEQASSVDATNLSVAENAVASEGAVSTQKVERITFRMKPRLATAAATPEQKP